MKRTPLSSMLMALFAACCLMGCPSDPPNPDGGTPDSRTPPPPPPKIECTKGTACIVISSGDVRGCELLIGNDKDFKDPTIGFHEDVIGSNLLSGKRIALGFVARKNESLAGNDARIVIKLPDGVAKLKLEKTICYDEKGAVTDKVEVKINRP